MEKSTSSICLLSLIKYICKRFQTIGIYNICTHTQTYTSILVKKNTILHLLLELCSHAEYCDKRKTVKYLGYKLTKHVLEIFQDNVGI